MGDTQRFKSVDIDYYKGKTNSRENNFFMNVFEESK